MRTSQVQGWAQAYLKGKDQGQGSKHKCRFARVSWTIHHAPLLLPAGAILLAQGPQHQQRRWWDPLSEHSVLSIAKCGSYQPCSLPWAK